MSGMQKVKAAIGHDKFLALEEEGVAPSPKVLQPDNFSPKVQRRPSMTTAGARGNREVMRNDA